jgi:ribosome-binding protein aMBF1 (putative translation factor)
VARSKQEQRDGADLLAEVKSSKQWSTRRLAAEIGCSAATVSRMISRQTFPNRKNIEAMSSKLGIPPQSWYCPF